MPAFFARLGRRVFAPPGLWRARDSPVKPIVSAQGAADRSGAGPIGRWRKLRARSSRLAWDEAEAGVVRFENVGLRYGLGPEVLRDLSFRIDPHSFQFLTGPSGAGKTSLLKLLFLSLKPTRGLVTQFGHDVASLSKDAVATLRRRIGNEFQEFRLLDHMTTYENVALPLRVMGRPEASYRDEVIELLNWVDLGDRMWSLPPVLSGGEKQRAAIARAVIARPQLLLADEPTGNVAPALAQRLLRLFVELNKSGTSVVIATHDIALMDQYDARRLVLHDGRLHIYD